MKTALVIALGVLLATLPSRALAQSDRELATRQELIARAQTLSDGGNHDEALALAKRAAAIKMTVSLRMFIAQEEAALGKIADAYGNGRQCATEAEADAQLHDRARILETCRGLEESLGKRVGRVTVNLPSPVPAGIHVVLSGEEVNAALLGTPYVVSPGTLTITATAAGFAPFSAEVPVPEGGSVEVNVRLVPEVPSPCPATQVRVGGACVPETPQCAAGLVARGNECVAAPAPPTAPPPAQPASSLPLGPILLGGSGVLVGVIATAVWLGGDSKYSQLKAQCAAAGGCSVDSYNSAASTIRLDDAIGVGGWIVGGALLASGVGWYVLGKPGEAGAPSARLLLDPATRSVGFAGAF
jgi:hypothetical protein